MLLFTVKVSIDCGIFVDTNHAHKNTQERFRARCCTVEYVTIPGVYPPGIPIASRSYQLGVVDFTRLMRFGIGDRNGVWS
ncbi:hypothetical protein KPH14_009394 [Odynerus spinipes]|uniref:Uncharacterized protein n=1 Tax=Odynerus spinipes TaxID=1348599 RepID=A0AAD9RPB5_9HYME|nr:hypothetical protein KPH14_009394 [Odynerus spinipes]